MIPNSQGRHHLSVVLAVGLCMIFSSLGLSACYTGNTEARARERSVSGGAYDITANFDVVLRQGSLAHGTNLWWTDQDAELWTARWAELGPSLVRVPVYHATIEPVNDNNDPNVIAKDGFLFDKPYDLPGSGRTVTLQALFTAVRNQPNLSIMLAFSYLAPWLSNNPPHPGLIYDLSPAPPNNRAEYREFVEAVLRYLTETLHFAPERILVEAMNEPDLQCGADPVVACFWQNWTMNDIAGVVQVTHDAIHAVNDKIRLVGLAECCGTSIVRNLLDNYPQGAFLGGLSYHYYSPSGFNLDEALRRATSLAAYRRPIYLDEYGSLQYRSAGVDGALWNSWALSTLWQAGIAPLQYPISEFPVQGEPYNSMGLFKDWRGNWERNPSYWAYANFFQLVSGGELIAHTAPPTLDVLTARRAGNESGEVAIWIVNRGSTTLNDLSIAVYNFPSRQATLSVYNNLAGPAPIQRMAVGNSPLVFTVTVPARSSSTLVLSDPAAVPGTPMSRPIFLPRVQTGQ